MLALSVRSRSWSRRTRANTPDPHLQVQGWPACPSCPANNPDHLPGYYLVTYFHEDLGLMHIAGKNTPTMIDHGGIAAHSERTGKDHYPRCRSIDLIHRIVIVVTEI